VKLWLQHKKYDGFFSTIHLFSVQVFAVRPQSENKQDNGGTAEERKWRRVIQAQLQKISNKGAN
jgi:hypothetical protein